MIILFKPKNEINLVSLSQVEGRSYFPLFVAIFLFLKKKYKGFPLLSGLGHQFPKEAFAITTTKTTPPCRHPSKGGEYVRLPLLWRGACKAGWKIFKIYNITIIKQKNMKNIAIIMGGYSSEYKISLISGNVVYNFLDKTKFNAFRIHIFKEKWVYVDDNDTEFPIDRNDFSVNINGTKQTFDCVFNAIHGTPGEDGLMQAYFELLNIPQTACDYYQAALTFNKRDLLSVLKPYGIKTANSYYLNKGDAINTEEIVNKLGLPCFVKPNKAGSSFGISKVKTAAELPIAIEVAYKEDNEIIIESFLDGTEVSVGVINYKGKITVLPITEIISENDFFDYEAKYQGKSQEITPARLSDEMTQKVGEIAKRAYEVLKMKGFSRSEFIIVDGEPHMLEMNTIPGLTTESLIPQQARAAGISLEDLFTNAIELVLN